MRDSSRRLVLVLAAALPGTAAAERSEQIFQAAFGYTVQVRTAVAAPFEPDLKGTLRGAGFMVDAARGWVMTNAHVVARSPSRVEVSGHGGRFHDARKVYVDPHLDIAIVELPPSARAGLAAAPLDCGPAPGVGHPVGAFGHPWNLKYTGTRGIVSGTASRAAGEMLQTDAPINGGNSGGPLISLETGRIVGVNTAQIRGSQNTNFAVAMRYACRVLELLRAGADPSPPDLKVVYFAEGEDQTALRVARNYAPGRLGLRAGDVIREIVGVPGRIRNETQLFHALRGRLDAFALRVERGGREIELAGSAAPMQPVAAARGLIAGGVLFGRTPLRDAAEVQVGRLMVHHVERGSDGDAKELARGDFVEAVDGRAAASLEELQNLFQAAHAAGRPVTLTLKRYGGSDRAFLYLQRELTTGAPQWVGDDLGAHAPAAAAPIEFAPAHSKMCPEGESESCGLRR